MMQNLQLGLCSCAPGQMSRQKCPEIRNQQVNTEQTTELQIKLKNTSESGKTRWLQEVNTAKF